MTTGKEVESLVYCFNKVSDGYLSFDDTQWLIRNITELISKSVIDFYEEIKTCETEQSKSVKDALKKYI